MKRDRLVITEQSQGFGARHRVLERDALPSTLSPPALPRLRRRGHEVSSNVWETEILSGLGGSSKHWASGSGSSDGGLHLIIRWSPATILD